MLDQLLDRFGVRVVTLLHHRVGGEALGVWRICRLKNLPKGADHPRARRHFLDDDRIRADPGALANRETAEHLRASADDHTRAERGMTLGAGLERSPAESHALVDRAAVADHRGLADHHA